MSETRAVCLNCMDGRVQLPVIHWIQQQCHVDYVDMITEPGMDALLADQNRSIETIIQKLELSIEKNNAKVIVIVGHSDCRGKPAGDSDKKDHVRFAINQEFHVFVAQKVHFSSGHVLVEMQRETSPEKLQCTSSESG